MKVEGKMIKPIKLTLGDESDYLVCAEADLEEINDVSEAKGRS